MEPHIKVTHTDSNPVCLDLANTLRWHASDKPQETLHSYKDLVTWALGVNLITWREGEDLLKISQDRPAEAQRVLGEAIALREVIYRIFATLATGDSPAESDLDELNTSLSAAMIGAHIVPKGDDYVWRWKKNVNEDALDSFLAPVARSAGSLLTSPERTRVGQCADDRGCGWLFVDTSKNRSRRWCSMEDCGNRAKQQRFYKKQDKSD